MARIALHGVDPRIARVLRRSNHKLLRCEGPVETAAEVDLALFTFDRSGREWGIALRKANHSLPIVAIVTSSEDAEAALATGCTDVLLRPVRSPILLARLAHLVQTHQLRKNLNSMRKEALLAQSGSVKPTPKLAIADDFLERLIDASPDPIICADLEGKILLYNRAAEAVLGYTQLEARARLHVNDLYSDDKESQLILQKIRASSLRRVEDHRARIRARNGETIPILISAAEIHDQDGKPVATVGIFRDTRESDSLASRLREATERLIRSEKRSAAVALAGATAHELNQPLTSVMGIVEIMLAAERPESEEQRLERAYEQLERMAEIVRDLSKVTQFKTTQYVEGVNILDLQQKLK
jgi:PAS domain S-box-containing protein